MKYVKYFAWFDEECGGNIIAFGTEREIQKDRLSGYGIDGREIAALKDFFDDDDSTEDYIIFTETPIAEIDEKMESLGYQREPRLKGIGWG